MFSDCRQDLTDAPVDFHDYVAIQPLLALPLEFVGDMQRHMGHRMRDVKEERPGLVVDDELYRVLGVPRCELRLVWHRGDGFVLLDQRQGGGSSWRSGVLATCRWNTAGQNTGRSRCGSAGTWERPPGAICQKWRSH